MDIHIKVGCISGGLGAGAGADPLAGGGRVGGRAGGGRPGRRRAAAARARRGRFCRRLRTAHGAPTQRLPQVTTCFIVQLHSMIKSWCFSIAPNRTILKS